MASDTAMAGETCKLCLKYVQGDELTSLDEDLLGKLEFLQLDLEQSVEESNSLCTDCEDKINNASNFKSCILNNENSDPSEPQEINGDIPSTSTGETSAEKATCHMCKLTVDKISVISLFKLLKDESVMEVLQGHIPEVSLTDSDKSMVCEVCQKSLASFSMLVQLWLTANDWNEDTKDDAEDFDFTKVKKEDNDVDFSDNTNSSSAFEVSNSASSSTASTSKKGKGKRLQASSAAGSSSSTSKKIKTEIDEVSDSSNSASLASVKKEETEENENADDLDELQLKSEEIDIKNEDEEGRIKKRKDAKYLLTQQVYAVDNKSKISKQRNISPRLALLLRRRLDHAGILRCTKCSYVTKSDTLLDRHDARNHNEVKCHICSFETKDKNCLKLHLLLHKKIDEAQMYNCNQSSFETISNNAVDNKSKISKQRNISERLALVLHKRVDKTERFNCTKCSYVTRFETVLKNHDAREHRNYSEMQVHKCHYCSFETKDKYCLKQHSLQHKKEDQFQIYNCVKSSSQKISNYAVANQRKISKQKNSSERLALVLHKTENDAERFRCEKCPYVTKSQGLLKRHAREKHHDYNKVQVDAERFKCEKCSYVTKSLGLLKKHARGKSHVYNKTQVHKCQICSFETNARYGLKQHSLLHQKIEEGQMFSCKQCSFQTIYKANLKSHLLTHKSLDEVHVYRCEQCPFRTKHNICLKNHSLKHKSSDQLKKYKCKECSFKTANKSYLETHLLRHKSLDEVPTYSCNDCSYRTIYKGYLKIHVLKHKSLNEVHVYTCQQCSYKTKYKPALKRHLLKHKK